MNIDLQELQQLAAVQPRLDLYSGIHKALRAFMADTLLTLGRVDVDEGPALAAATQQVIDLMDLCVAHLRHENEFVHIAIEARAPGASSAIAHDHAEHLQHTAQLRAAAIALRAASAAVRPALCQALYRELAVFMADNLQHMHVEETAHNAVLWARYTDAELAQIHDALLATIPPAEMALVARWMLPFMQPAERLGMRARPAARCRKRPSTPCWTGCARTSPRRRGRSWHAAWACRRCRVC
jgi:hypothetical protein